MVRKIALGAVVAAAVALSAPSAHAFGYKGPFFNIGQPIAFTETGGSVATPFFASVARAANVFGSSTVPNVPARTAANTGRLFGNMLAAGFIPTSPPRWGLAFN